MSEGIRLKPPTGQQYRDTVTRQLVDPEGFTADPCDLDIVRAIECGDLVPVNPKKAVAGQQKD